MDVRFGVKPHPEISNRNNVVKSRLGGHIHWYKSFRTSFFDLSSYIHPQCHAFFLSSSQRPSF